MSTTLVVINDPIAFVAHSSDGAVFPLFSADSATGVVTSTILTVRAQQFLTEQLQHILAKDPTLSVATAFPVLLRNLVGLGYDPDTGVGGTSVAVAGTLYTLSVDPGGIGSVLISIPHSIISPFSLNGHINDSGGSGVVGTWKQTGPEGSDYYEPGAAVLNDGRALICGGGSYTRVFGTKKTSLYDAGTNGWTPGPDLPVELTAHSLGRIEAGPNQGNLLTVGGYRDPLFQVDPATNVNPAFTIRFDGQDLIKPVKFTTECFRYSPTSNSWVPTGSYPIRELIGIGSAFKRSRIVYECLVAPTTIAGADANGGVKYYPHVTGAIRVEHIVAGLNTPLSVSKTALDLTVNLATDGAGVAISTAADVVRAVKNYLGGGKFGTDASIVAGAPAGQMRVTGLAGMVAGDVGRSLLLGAAASAGNNSATVGFTIVTVNSATSVDVTNGAAVIPDANNGTLRWQVLPVSLVLPVATGFGRGVAGAAVLAAIRTQMRVKQVVAGVGTPYSSVVAVNDITINVATDGAGVAATAAATAASVNADGALAGLVSASVIGMLNGNAGLASAVDSTATPSNWLVGGTGAVAGFVPLFGIGGLANDQTLTSRSRKPIVLPDGRMLTAGHTTAWGELENNETPNAARHTFIYNPTTELWSRGPDLAVPRTSHASIGMPNGKVLVAGGWSSNFGNNAGNTEALSGLSGAAASVIAGAVQGAPPLAPDRVRITLAGNLTLLAVNSTLELIGAASAGNNGRFRVAAVINATTVDIENGAGVVLDTNNGAISWINYVGAGLGNPASSMVRFGLGSAEIYDPNTNLWTAAPDMPSPGDTDSCVTNPPISAADSAKRAWTGEVLLPDGKVLLAGGLGYTGISTRSPDFAVTIVAVLQQNASGVVLQLNSVVGITAQSGVRIIQGGNTSPPVAIVDPATNTVTTLSFISVPVTTFVPGAATVGTAGLSNNNARNSSVIFDPVAGTWQPFSATNNMLRATAHVPITKVSPLGGPEKVLVVAGSGGGSPLQGFFGRLAISETFDQVSGRWAPSTPMPFQPKVPISMVGSHVTNILGIVDPTTLQLDFVDGIAPGMTILQGVLFQTVVTVDPSLNRITVAATAGFLVASALIPNILDVPLQITLLNSPTSVRLNTVDGIFTDNVSDGDTLNQGSISRTIIARNTATGDVTLDSAAAWAVGPVTVTGIQRFNPGTGASAAEKIGYGNVQIVGGDFLENLPNGAVLLPGRFQALQSTATTLSLRITNTILKVASTDFMWVDTYLSQGAAIIEYISAIDRLNKIVTLRATPLIRYNGAITVGGGSIRQFPNRAFVFQPTA